jgi:integrase
MSKQKQTRRRFTAEFKAETVKLVKQSDRSIAGLAMELGTNAVSLLRRVCSLHVENRLLDTNPAKGAKKLVTTVARRYKTQVERIDSWTFDESRTLLDVASVKETAIYPAVLAALHTGMRRGELLALKWEDINFDRSRITIRRARVRGKVTLPKSGKAREVPISPELSDVLTQLAESRQRREGFAEPEWVFLSPKGKPLMERNFNRSFSRLTTTAAKKGVRPLNLHCCRHTFATLALESGRNIKWVAEVLGHSDATITLRTYTHALHKEDDDLSFLSANRGESPNRPSTVPNRPRKLMAVVSS